jgi:hypothetical protein
MDTPQLETYIDAQCALLGLTLAPGHRPGVVHYLRLVVGMAPRVMDFPLGVADEPGHVFVPVAPGEGAAP